MSTVRLSFTPAPVHVRTARLVGVAVARRAGVAEELLEEIRLAIGEACSRAVALHRTNGIEDMVDVSMDDAERFTVRVIDRVGDGMPPKDPAAFLAETPSALAGAVGAPGPLNEEAVAARMGLALLAGLVDDLEVVRLVDGIGTEVSMSWPMERRTATG
jgi:anti-sigma regulatory factor (Ser/Thr protein kinase)